MDRATVGVLLGPALVAFDSSPASVSGGRQSNAWVNLAHSPSGMRAPR